MATDEGKTPEGEQAPPGGGKPPVAGKGGGFPKWALWTIITVVVLVIAGAAVGIVLALGGDSGGANQSPTISSLTANPPSVAPGQGSTITCVATDADGDTLSYDWVSTGGTVSGTGSIVTWVAPSVSGTFSVGVTVDDGNGGTASEDVNIVVGIVAPIPTPTPTPTATPTSAPTPTPSEGSINIQSNPAGAKVYIDGTDTGNITPYTATHVSAGSHTVKLVIPHYKWRQGAVTVAAGDTEYINWALDWAPAQSVTIQPDAADGKDAYVYQGGPGIKFGATDSEDLFVSGNGVGLLCRTYAQFDLSSIPSTAVVTSASMGLYYYAQSGTATAGPVGVYRVTSDWIDTEVTWSDQPTAVAGPSDTEVMPAVATNDFVWWDIVDLVRDWHDGSIDNYGVLLKDTDESTFEGYKKFYASDWGTANQRPKLTIDYYDPAP
ncbi:MAG: DNRLRE domain-containing protein [Chloroflexota bacterium]|nr:DNRLRE domain-containing protein [Chloroflexota bacterium]